MQLIVFSKMLQQKSIAELIDLAQRHGYDGYDLAVRPGHPVNPENAAAALPEAQAQMTQAGLRIGMVTGNFDLLTADHPLGGAAAGRDGYGRRAAAEAGLFQVRAGHDGLLGAGGRGAAGPLPRGEKLASIYNVKVCYHTHSHYCMGLNAAALMHLLRDFDPALLGAYLDPGHFAVDGEPFDFGLAMGARIPEHTVDEGCADRARGEERPRRGAHALGARRRGHGGLDGRFRPSCGASTTTDTCRFTASTISTRTKIGTGRLCARWRSSAG